MNRHPTFICMLTAQLREDIPDPEWHDTNGMSVPSPCVEADRTEHHELIYTDGNIALTMFQHCYAMFYVQTGTVFDGSLWRKGEWILTEESRQLILGWIIDDQSDDE